jgi:hypothetical protein
MLIGLAAAGVTAMLALPAPAVAKERPADGVRNVEQMEFSARRRDRRVVIRSGPRRAYHRSFYRPHRYAYAPYRYAYHRPYRAYRYAYRPYRAYRYAYAPAYYAYPYHTYAYAPYYYRRGPHIGFGPFGFSIGFGF